MDHTFIDGASSAKTYLIIGLRESDGSKLAIRRLVSHDGSVVRYRVHDYPNLAAFNLEPPTADHPNAYSAMRHENCYETVHMNGDDEVRDYLLPGLASRGITAMEFQEAVESLKTNKPKDNNPAAHKAVGLHDVGDEQDGADPDEGEFGSLYGEDD